MTISLTLERDSQPVPGDDPAGPLTRMARGQSLAGRDVTAATATAVRYQLISRHTNYLVVDARADDKKREGLPGLRKVPQMLAAGWGGTGSLVREIPVLCRDVRFMRKMRIPHALYSITRSPEEEHRRRQQTTPVFFIYNCNRLHTKWLNPSLQMQSIEDLLDCDLPDRIAAAVRSIADQIDPQTLEELIVLAFLVALLQSPAGTEMNRNTRRAIKKTRKILRPDDRLIDFMANAFAHTTKDDWGPDYPLEDDQVNIDEARC